MQPHVVPVVVGTNVSNVYRRVKEEYRVGYPPHCCVNEAYGRIYTYLYAERLPLGLAAGAIDRNVCYT